MASASGSNNDNDLENGFRLQLLREIIENTLREIFHQHFPRDPYDLYQRFCSIEKKIKDIQKKGRINKYQVQLLLPPTKVTESSSFDASLLVFLLNEFCGYNSRRLVLRSEDRSTQANILRLTAARNRIQHTCLRVTNTVYDEICQSIKNPLLELGCSNEELEMLDKIAIGHKKYPNLKKTLDKLETHFSEIKSVHKGIVPLPDTIKITLDSPFESVMQKLVIQSTEEPESIENLNGEYFYVNEDDLIIREENNGVVYLGYSLKNWVAITECRSREEPEELKWLKSIHEKTPTSFDLLHCCFNSERKMFNIVMPLYEYNLEEYLSFKPSYTERFQMVEQLLSLLECLHDDDTLHGNLKPSSIMIASKNNPIIKLVNFVMPVTYKQGRTRNIAIERKWVLRNNLIGVFEHHSDFSYRDNPYDISFEMFGACMLIVFIISGGEHPFCKPKDDKIPLFEVFKKTKRIRVDISFDDKNLLSYLNNLFSEFYDQMLLPGHTSKISDIKIELRKFYSKDNFY